MKANVMTTSAQSNPGTNTASADVRRLVRNQQKSFRKVRGRAAHAQLIAAGYVAIRQIQRASPEVQAAILDEHGVNPAPKSASQYGPLIKVIWGEYHPDPAKTFRDLTGAQRRVWVPDRSMEVYHHTMEELEDLGIDSDHAAVILEHGGAQAMANKRKRRLRDANSSNREAEQKEKRELLLREIAPPFIKVSISLPEDVGEFVTIACRRRDDGFELLGIVNKDATATVNKLAQDRYDELIQAVELREKEAHFRPDAEKVSEEGFIEGDPETVGPLHTKLTKSALVA